MAEDHNAGASQDPPGRPIILTAGTVVDGTGGAPRKTNVLIRGETIAEVGAVEPAADWATIDCSGLRVAPGFIDVHSHGDQEVLEHLPNKVLQGVTTELVGNCGFSLFPTHPNPAGERLTGELFDGEPAEGMADGDAYFSALERGCSRVNVAALTGHSALRVFVMKARREAGDQELKQLEQALEDCLASGSIGLSTGLNCVPGRFAEFEELERLCRVVRKHDAFYTSHLRDYKFKVIEAVDEALALGRATGAPVQLSHLQVVGKKNWQKLDEVLEHVDRAHRDGVDVAMDAYPYLAGSCPLTQLLPAWSLEGGIPGLLQRLETPEGYERIAAETDDGMSNTWDDIVICGVAGGRTEEILGRSVARIATERDRRAAYVALDLLREYSGGVRIISINNNEDNLRTVLTHALNMVITDGLVMEGISHPRTFGTYPKFLGEYVREKKWMSLEQAIVKTSALAAQRFRLQGRGTIKDGTFADLVIFDADKIGTASDYDNPRRDPQGIRHVLVNGRCVVRDGKLTDELPGKALRH
jgi:dihydroorotase/N-acyl-D-amino-acid deacylase